MNKYIEILSSMELFQKLSTTEIESVLTCLSEGIISYEKGNFVDFPNTNSHTFGILLSGQLQIIQDDYFGNRSIISNIYPGHIFGESFAFAKKEILSIQIISLEESELLYINSEKLTTPCSKLCSYHNQLIQNMLYLISAKNILLTEKIGFVSKRTTREKVLSYLSVLSVKYNSDELIIPFNRQELADYLCVDRSALSSELSKLKKEGFISFKKNKFKLL